MFIYRLVRFFSIDFDYLLIKKPFFKKISNIIKTDYTLCFNLIFRRKKFTPIQLEDRTIYYDTPFATKTFLAAAYDFYIVTQKATLFGHKPKIDDLRTKTGQC